MKGILLAGGSGSRLSPVTDVVNKHLLPIYDRPMAFYPLSTLVSAGIKDILVISTTEDTPLYSKLLGNGENIGVSIKYAAQASPDGIAQAFIIAEDFIGDEPVTLILGDNVFTGKEVVNKLEHVIENIADGASIFGFPVKDPERFGVAEIDEDGKLVSIIEKPDVPPSNIAVAGLYVYGSGVSKRARSLVPSERGELEITDLNRMYLEEGLMELFILGEDCHWLDTGTHETLFEASKHVRQLALSGKSDISPWDNHAEGSQPK